VLDCGLWAPHGVEHYKITAVHANYKQNLMIAALLLMLNCHLLLHRRLDWCFLLHGRMLLKGSNGTNLWLVTHHLRQEIDKLRDGRWILLT